MKKPVKKTVDDAMHKAMQDKLIALAEKPLTPRSLLELEQMTRLVRQMIAIGQDPMAMKSAPLPNINPSVYQPEVPQAYPFDSGGGVVAMSGAAYNGVNAMAPSPPVENFGATIVRELMTLLGAVKKPEPIPVSSEASRLLDAIDLAREKGLKDVENALMKQLVKKSMDDMPPPAEPPLPEPKKPKAANGAKA